MSQNTACGCGHSQLTMLPVHGFSLAVDASGLLPAPAPVLACRERVDQAMHIYINGNLSESGDGLSPETAVNSYADAVLALSRYDGCNTYNAWFHFADLRNTLALYPALSIYSGHYATFSSLYISGESHETTNLGQLTVSSGCDLFIEDICMTSLNNISAFTRLRKKTAFNPQDKKYALLSQHGGAVSFGMDSEIYFHGATYHACCYIKSSSLYNVGNCKMHTLGPVIAELGFLFCTRSGSINLSEAVDYTGCTGVTGRKYNASFLSSIYTCGKTLPGSEPGALYNCSVYA